MAQNNMQLISVKKIWTLATQIEFMAANQNWKDEINDMDNFQEWATKLEVSTKKQRFLKIKFQYGIYDIFLYTKSIRQSLYEKCKQKYAKYFGFSMKAE